MGWVTFLSVGSGYHGLPCLTGSWKQPTLLPVAPSPPSTHTLVPPTHRAPFSPTLLPLPVLSTHARTSDLPRKFRMVPPGQGQLLSNSPSSVPYNRTYSQGSKDLDVDIFFCICVFGGKGNNILPTLECLMDI